jgi:hypothetical protein
MSSAKNPKGSNPPPPAEDIGEEPVKNKKVAPTKPDEMSDELIEFITAIDEYKRVHQRPFPSWGEVLEVIKTLGYQRAG